MVEAEGGAMAVEGGAKAVEGGAKSTVLKDDKTFVFSFSF